MPKSVNSVLAENLRSLKAATPKGVPSGQLHIGNATKIGESTVGRARRADGNITLENLAALAKYYKREAWELLCPQFRPGVPLRIVTEDELEAEVHRRLMAMVAQSKALEVSDEKARAGPSVAYPFGPVQNARPEPPVAKKKANPKDGKEPRRNDRKI